MESSKPSKTLQNRGGKLRKNISESEKKKENLTAGRMRERKCGKKKCLSLGYCCCCFVVYSPKAKVWTATAAADGCCCAGCVRIAEQQLLLRSSAAGFFFPSRTVAELHRRRHLVCTVHYHRQYSRSVGADFVAVDGVIGG